MDHWKSRFVCVFWQWIIGNLVFCVHFGNGSLDIQFFVSILAMDHCKSYFVCVFLYVNLYYLTLCIYIYTYPHPHSSPPRPNPVPNPSLPQPQTRSVNYLFSEPNLAFSQIAEVEKCELMFFSADVCFFTEYG